MNNVYFVRHATPDFSIKDELLRPLTEEGIKDSIKVSKYLKSKDITKIYSSPYKRAVDTISNLSSIMNLDVEVVEDLRERKICNEWIEDFNGFTKKQWSDFLFKLEDGECLKEVQDRNIKSLLNILSESHKGNIVIGTHGTALSTIINYYDNTFNYESFNKIKNIMPFIVCIKFNGTNATSIEFIFDF